MAFIFEHLPKRIRGARIILDNQDCSGATHFFASTSILKVVLGIYVWVEGGALS
jgi:hypothetical protein